MPRTPNTECIICAKPLYRRPGEMARVRYAACMSCRGKAQSVIGVTEAQKAGLALGSRKGFNGRIDYRHRDESKLKTSRKNKAFWAANPDKAKERGAKNRDEHHYKWKGGVARLNTSIRQMHEYRVWARTVCERDGCCVRCGSDERLEAHHTRSFAKMLEDCGVKNRADARRNAVTIFDPNIGKTLCVPCHDAEHGGKPRADRRTNIRKDATEVASFVRESI